MDLVPCFFSAHKTLPYSQLNKEALVLGGLYILPTAILSRFFNYTSMNMLSNSTEVNFTSLIVVLFTFFLSKKPTPPPFLFFLG